MISIEEDDKASKGLFFSHMLVFLSAIYLCKLQNDIDNEQTHSRTVAVTLSDTVNGT